MSAAEHVTDEQWITLIDVVKDDRQWMISYPDREGASVHVKDPENRGWVVRADGSAWGPMEAEPGSPAAQGWLEP